MPELPEVETIRRQIGPLVTGRRVLEAWAFPSAKFIPAIEVSGAQLRDANRRGKYLIFPTDDGRELIAHLGMTGSFSFTTEPDALASPHLRAWWRLAGHGNRPEETLLFNDTRRFGRLRVVAAGHYEAIPTLAAMGPEPFDPTFTAKEFWRLLSRSRRHLKTNLLSQRPIAGVGNIYADEALWRARISPIVTRLGLGRAEELLESLRVVLHEGISNGGTTLKDYRNIEGGEGRNQHRLAAYGRAGQPCLRCNNALHSARIDTRTTTWCRRCQSR